MAKKFYAYFFDCNNASIVNTWEECKSIIHGSNARYKSFSSLKEAENWLKNGAIYEYGKNKSISISNIVLEDGVFFDAGTGRGRGVEVRVTDKNKKSLISVIEDENFKKFLEKKFWFINEYGNIELGKNKTNNYGELLGLYLALECAKKMKLTKIFGDSKLVISYWSKGKFHSDKLPLDTVSLIKKVIENRKIFETTNGKVEYISGDINPADLGFHK